MQLRRAELTLIRHHVRARAAEVTALTPAITPTLTSTPRMPMALWTIPATMTSVASGSAYAVGIGLDSLRELMY